MVSLWPWRSNDSAATFEKTLASLAGRISRTAARNDTLRQRSRRVRVMWTLYAGFAYILATLLLLLVTGWRSWGPTEISVVSGGPVMIYMVRTCLTTYYDYRLSNTQKYLETLHKERDDTIEKLKAATKYNSTQQLLEKYGSAPKPKETQPSPSQRKPQGPQKPTVAQGGRTNIAPPATANIPRPGSARPATPQRLPPAPASPQGLAQEVPAQLPPPPPGAEFAPNAFDQEELPRQYSSSSAATFTQSHWYDRILDALLGEDETQPKNRLALICRECRLVNGQAPPGARTLEDVGKWRCMGCSAWNGKERAQEDVVAGLVQNWEEERNIREKDAGGSTEGGVDCDNRETEDSGVLGGTDEGSVVDLADDSVEEKRPTVKPTKSKSKGKGKK